MNNNMCLILPPKLSGGQNCQNSFLEPVSKITLSHDWIEFTGEIESHELPANLFLFSVSEEQHGTAYFRKLFKVETIYHGETIEFANLEMQPRPSFLNEKLVRVKLHNRFCYTPNISKIIENFCRELKITFKHYTRIDYALDFQSVNYFGENIQQLLHAFASKQLVVKGKSMKVHSTVSKYTGVTFGSRSSGLSCTLYNKTLEMNKKSGKPWIYGLWQDAGFNMEKETFRLEFSTKKPRYDIIDDGGATYGNYAEIDFLENFNEHINFLYHKLFQIGINETGKRFSRLQRFFIIPIEKTVFRPVTPCVKPQSNNIKKTVIKNIVLEALYMQKRGERVEASYAWEMAMHYVSRYSLDSWWAKTFDRLNIKSSYLTHYDIVNMESIRTKKLKQADLCFN